MALPIRHLTFNFNRPAAIGFATGLLALVSGCSAPTMRNQFRNYNEAYADSLNQQMLLNLARLENGHPAYYLAIGLIDNKYTFSSQTAAGTTGAYTSAGTTTDNTPSVSGAPSAIAGFPAHLFSTVLTRVFGYNLNETVTATSNPEFQFIPINNETAARQVLEPISTDVFLTLYEQGYPIDQLLRVLIERIETPKLPDGTRLVLVNSPTRGTPEGYARFLRACGMLRELQRHGYLALEAGADLELLGSVSFGSSGKGKDGGGGGSAQNDSNPSPKDFSDAEDKGFVLKTNDTGGWQIFRKRSAPRFVLRNEAAVSGTARASQVETNALAANQLAQAAIAFLKTNDLAPGILEYKRQDYEAVTNVVVALSRGIAVQTGVNSGQGEATRLVLRSFNRAMEAVAGEQAGYDELVKNDPKFTDKVSASEQRPVLKLLWHDTRSRDLEPPLETVRYADKTYQITDLKTGPLDPGERWNRDVFRLMVELGSQVTVDISKFQRQVLELTQ